MQIHSSLMRSYNGYLSTHSKVDKEEALALIDLAKEINKDGGSGCCGFGKPEGDKSLKGLIEDRKFRDKFDSESLMVIKYYLSNHRLPSTVTPAPSRPDRPNPTSPTTPAVPGSSLEKVIIDWTASKKTWNCPWFPQLPTQAGGDSINNLFGPDGACDRYDQATGRKSRDFELANHTSNVDWHGHCNHAAQVSALLREPVKDVVFNGVTFTPHHIKGLLVMVIQSLCTSDEMVGERYDGPNQDPYEPNPVVFLEEVLKPWCKPGGLPIILDVDNTEQVWNFPYDSVKVIESDKPPADVVALPPLGGGKIKYYTAEMKGTGYEDREKKYRFWIQYDNAGKPLARNWMQMEDPSDTKINPDFCWKAKPNGDLNNPATWTTNVESQDNPEVRAEDVFKIYMASI